MSLRYGALCVCINVIVASSLAAIGAGPNPKLRNRPHGKQSHGLLKHARSRESHTAKHVQRHEHENREHAHSHKVKMADPEPPRMFVAEGCDGSTAILQHAVKVLKLHGVDGGDPTAQKELLDAPRNPYYVDDQNKTIDIVQAMQALQKEHRDKQQTLVFKSILHRDLQATLNNRMVQMGTMAVYVTRKNLLDQLVCMVRDCFLNTDKETTRFGYPVDEQGKPSNLCFERRSTNDKGYKAMIKVVEPVPNGQHNRSYISENLDFLEQQATTGYQLLQKAGYKAPQIAYEDLVAFEEGGADKLQISLKAWSEMLAAWGVQANANAVRKYLLSQGSTWKTPGQSKSIYNFEEVVAELKNIGREDQVRN